MYCSILGKNQVAWHYRTVKDFFDSAINDVDTLPDSFLGLFDFDETGLMKSALELYKLIPVPANFKDVYKAAPIFNLLFPRTKDVMNMFALMEDIYMLSHNSQKDYSLFKALKTYIATGSKSVITLNLNRIIQDFMRLNDHFDGEYDPDDLKQYITDILDRVYKYHIAYNELLWDLYDNDMMPVYSEGYISLNQQFLTIGINGLNEAAEFLGLKINDNDLYQRFCNLITSTISEQNRLHENTKSKHQLKFNCSIASLYRQKILLLKIINTIKKMGIGFLKTEIAITVISTNRMMSPFQCWKNLGFMEKDMLIH